MVSDERHQVFTVCTVELVHANTAQRSPRADLVDEIQMRLALVLLGVDPRLFEHLAPSRIELNESDWVPYCHRSSIPDFAP
jgi:hypothetical protein